MQHAQSAMYPPPLFPPAPAHHMQVQPVYDGGGQFMHMGHDHQYAQGMAVNAVVDRESWMKSRNVTPVQAPHVGDGAAAHGMQLRGLHRPHSGGDQSMSMADSEDAPRAHHGPTHSERTLDKWEHLLRTKPDDPMAFYWREQIQWCKVRGSDTQGGGLEATGVKRAHPTSGVGVEEGVEVIDRLVKRIRCCDDAPVAHPGSW
eukprot:CAMPEP_0173471078 /NCGR_PEP_ID=MMETSP1357-20121228/78213_1 /TAXON_ID=77926 /ORGANISM="Hemiselmis rufescens, Strain PCC563" /LENGTH=201 /DNA_ID=CAMNT_0014439379 /DNA_START=512 /DNA_END=1114 /DNA_ORIENTATION=-